MFRYTLRQLEYALAAAERGSVAAAAEALGVAQPSVSAAIKKLEDQLGLQLFIRRHAQGAKPSTQGERFLAQARDLLRHAEEVQREASEASGEISGELTLGCFATLAPAYLPELVRRFRNAYPRASLKLRDGTQDDLIGGLRNGTFDLALLYKVDLPADLRASEIATFMPYVLLPRGHRLAKRRKVPVAELKGEPFILLDIPPSRTYFTRILESQGLASTAAYSSPSLELVRGLVGQGLGYSILVTRPHGDMSYDGQPLAIKPILEAVEPGVIALATLASVRPTRLLSTFEQFAKEFFEKRRS
jgi:DNA-binding transcriptional LysR family regulator